MRLGLQSTSPTMTDTTGSQASHCQDDNPPSPLPNDYHGLMNLNVAWVSNIQDQQDDTVKNQTTPSYTIFLPNQCGPASNPDAWLPQGWTVGNRQHSVLELETNIRTLGELYETLSTLRSQLPSAIAAAVESQQHKPDKHASVVRPASDAVATEVVDTPVITTPGMLNYFSQQLSQYPGFVFKSLIRLHLQCVSYPRLDPDRFLEKFEQNQVHPALVCAIYAFSALHGMVSHPDQFGLYPFMEQLANDCYRVAHDLVEFDVPSKTTVETLVLMHKYRVATGHTEETLLCLAVRHLEWLLSQPEEQGRDVDRLQAWMLKHDLALSVRTFTKPVMAIPSKLAIKQETGDRRLRSLATELDGLVCIVQNQSAALESWCISTRRAFPIDPVKPDAYALRLHIVYFGGKLYIHQRDMIQAYKNGNNADGNQSWADYFQQPPSPDTAIKVERALLVSMQAAFGFIEVIRTCLEVNERCMIIEIMDTLSASFTVLYFGMKMMPAAQTPCQGAMKRLLEAFASSPAMMACVGIRQFVTKWNKLI